MDKNKSRQFLSSTYNSGKEKAQFKNNGTGSASRSRSTAGVAPSGIDQGSSRGKTGGSKEGFSNL